MYFAKILAPKNGFVKISNIYFCREILLALFHCDIWNPLAEKVGNWRRGNCRQKWARWRESSSALTYWWKWNHLYGKSWNPFLTMKWTHFWSRQKALTNEKSNCPSFKYLTRSKSSPENVCSTRTSFFQWDFLAQNCVHNGNNVCTMQIMNKTFHG